MPRGKRSPGQTSITISVSEKLRDEIDECAAEDDRTRSGWIVSVLKKKIAALKAQRKLDADAPKLATVKSPAVAPIVGNTPHTSSTPFSTNEDPKRKKKPVTRARAALRAMTSRELKSKPS